MASDNSDEIINEIKRMLQGSLQMLSCGNLREDELCYVQFRLDRIEHILSLCLLANIRVDDRVLSNISEAKCEILEMITRQQQAVNSFQSEKVFDGDRGRPQYNISEKQLSYFIGFGFRAPEIATMLGVSESTIRRPFREFNLSTTCYTDVSDEQLDVIVSSIKDDFKQSGYRILAGIGILKSRGICVPQRRVLESLRRVDLEGVILRSLKLRTINRRKYKVWQIDTNHKLIR